MLVLVLPVGSGGRCDVERAFGEMLERLPKWAEGFQLLMVQIGSS